MFGSFFYEIIKDLLNLLYIKIEKFKNIIFMEAKRFWVQEMKMVVYFYIITSHVRIKFREDLPVALN